MKVSLQRAVSSLATALDLVGIDPVDHGRRVALMAVTIAEDLAWSAARRDNLLYAGLIHDCGVSRRQERRDISSTLEWHGAEEHCELGEAFVLACPPLARMAAVVRWHHTRWEDLPAALDESLRLDANLVCLADRVEILLQPYFAAGALKNDLLWEFPTIVERIAALAGRHFSPLLVAAFRRSATRESFWLAMDPHYIEDELAERMSGAADVELGVADALALAGLFARTADAKSSYTLEHSVRVGKIARHLAAALGMSGEDLDRVEIAGLLHDIGKLRVPLEIIDKPGPLTAEERAYVTRHSFDTGRMLKKIFPGEPIAEWAANHHENLLGTGYPHRQGASGLSPVARLIAVADIFQSLAQERPYRQTMAADDVVARLERLREQGRIDADMVALLRANVVPCYALAVG